MSANIVEECTVMGSALFAATMNFATNFSRIGRSNMIAGKTSTGLVDYAKAQVGKPYWYGTYGQTATEELLEYKRKQYKSNYTAKDFESQLGQRVHDCAGLIKGYIWSESPTSAPKYNGPQDVGVSGLYQLCTERGPINALPEIPGVLVFTANNSHVGVYCGNEVVVEARGHSFGVVQTKLKDRAWKYWGKLTWLDYENNHVPQRSYYKNLPNADKLYIRILPFLYKGKCGADVILIQFTLNQLKCCEKLVVDGIFGIDTAKAVLTFQRKAGLKADGYVGIETWAALHWYMKNSK